MTEIGSLRPALNTDSYSYKIFYLNWLVSNLLEKVLFEFPFSCCQAEAAMWHTTFHISSLFIVIVCAAKIKIQRWMGSFFMLRCLSFSVCSIQIERKVSPDLIYNIYSNISFTSTRQDKEKCSKATSKVRSWKTRLETM